MFVLNKTQRILLFYIQIQLHIWEKGVVHNCVFHNFFLVYNRSIFHTVWNILYTFVILLEKHFLYRKKFRVTNWIRWIFRHGSIYRCRELNQSMHYTKKKYLTVFDEQEKLITHCRETYCLWNTKNQIFRLGTQLYKHN